MTLEKYIEWFNFSQYPINYPYYLRMGIRSNLHQLSLVVQLVIHLDDGGIDCFNKEFLDILTIYGDTDEEILDIFSKLEFSRNNIDYFKTDFKQLWNK